LLKGNVADITTSVYCGLIGVPQGKGLVKGGGRVGWGAFDDSASNSRQLYRTRRVAGTRLARGRKFPNLPKMADNGEGGPMKQNGRHEKKKKKGGGRAY